MQHKVIITDEANDINPYLEKGWLVKDTIPQHVSVSTANQYSASGVKVVGKFCFVLEKDQITSLNS